MTRTFSTLGMLAAVAAVAATAAFLALPHMADVAFTRTGSHIGIS